MIHVPKLKVYGAGDLNRIMPFSFDGEVADQIGSYGKEFRELHKGSITLGEQAALFNWYLASELGEAPEMPEDVKDTVYMLFDKIGYGNVTDDACDYDGGQKGLKKVKDTDRSVRWIIRPEGFEKGENRWSAKLGENSNIRYITIPETGYVELTVDGPYRPDTGTPFSTVSTRKEAEKSWTKRGFDPEFARKAVSRFWSREEGQGTASVGRWCNDDGGGRFNVSADDGPGFWNLYIGSLPVSRTAERSEASPEDRGIKVITVDEYRGFEAAAERLKAVENALKG